MGNQVFKLCFAAHMSRIATNDLECIAHQLSVVAMTYDELGATLGKPLRVSGRAAAIAYA